MALLWGCHTIHVGIPQEIGRLRAKHLPGDIVTERLPGYPPAWKNT